MIWFENLFLIKWGVEYAGNQRKIVEGRKIGFVPKQAKNQIMRKENISHQSMDLFRQLLSSYDWLHIHYNSDLIGQKKLPPNQEQSCKIIQVWCNSKSHSPSNLNQFQPSNYIHGTLSNPVHPSLKGKSSQNQQIRIAYHG